MSSASSQTSTALTEFIGMTKPYHVYADDDEEELFQFIRSLSATSFHAAASVLEGLTGLPFPRLDGVCTKSTTEIILQHSTDEQVIVATITPAKEDSDVEKAKLRDYSCRLASFDELPSTIEDVGYLMGIRGFESLIEGFAFGQDVLRIEVSGPTGLHLTVVDLPGIISVANEEQTDEDVETVQTLVDSYIANARTIVLAVVQASNDIANQGIIQKPRRFDKKGQRTVRFITKPDVINIGTGRESHCWRRTKTLRS